MPVRAGWVPCVGIQPPKPEVVYIEGGATISRECEGLMTSKQQIIKEKSETTEMSMGTIQQKPKPNMKLIMNPKGVQDHSTVDQHYQQLMEQQQHSSTVNSFSSSSTSSSTGLMHSQMPVSPEIVKDIMNDMQSPTGKGAALFAKRKKRMDKFIVDETTVQKNSAYQQQQSCVQSSSTMQQQFSSSNQQQLQQKGPLPSSIGTSNKKKSVQERDAEQAHIMDEFMKTRESAFKLVKTPWDAVIETGDTSAAFQQKIQTKFESSSSASSSVSTAAAGPPPAQPSWLEMPKPVPVSATVPGSGAPQAPLPTPPSPFGSAPFAGPTQHENMGLVVGSPTGLMYTAEVKLVQPTVVASPLQNQALQPSAAPKAAPVVHQAHVVQKQTSSNNQLTQAEIDERRMSLNFNLAASGFGTYNKFYRPISFVSSS